MNQKSITLQLAEYAISDHFHQFSEADIHMTKLSFIDWLAAAISGRNEESVKLLMELAVEENVSGNCVILGKDSKTSPLYAALINGTESHAIDFDDIHDFLSLHLTSPVLPAALAAAEYIGASGAELINASINGMQIMVALSAAMMPEHYNNGRWHATGTIGVFGAAAAAGAILRLAPEEMCNAFGICSGLCCGIQLNFGTMTKPMAAGVAAENGLKAAMLAKKGFTGRTDIFDTEYLNNLSLKEIDFSKIVDRLIGPFGVHELRFKRYPCGAPTHSGIINCKKIFSEHHIDLEEVQKVVFEPYPRAIRLVGITHPKTGLEGKFSIPFTAAAQMVFGQVTIETFTNKAVQDQRVLSLLDRMEMIPNEEFNHSRGGKATIYLKDGRSFSSSTYLLGHDLDLEKTEPDVLEKYREIMIPRMGRERTEIILTEFMMLEKAESLTQLSAIL